MHDIGMKTLSILIGAGLFGSVAGLGSIILPTLTPEQLAKKAETSARVGARVEASVEAGVEASVYYAGCDEVRLLGKAPLYRGQPGYRSGMDGDNDGIACEPRPDF